MAAQLAEEGVADPDDRPPVPGIRALGPRELGVAALVASLTLFVFAPTLEHGFLNFDDDAYVTENPLVRRGLTTDGVAAAFRTVHTFTWHPLATLSHMLDCEIWDVDPFGHHLSSVLLHALTAAALVLVLYRATGALAASAFVAAAFAVHPLRVESVAWISERKDVLSGLFFVLTLGAWRGFAARREATGRFPAVRYLVALACFVLALLSKPMVVTLPFVLLLFDAWPLGRLKGGRKLGGLLLEKVPFLMLAVACAAITLQTQAGAMTSAETLPLGERLSNAVVSYFVYVRQLFWPVGLAIVVPHQRELPLPTVAGAAAFLTVVSVYAWLRRRRGPAVPVGWAWYLGMLVPVIGLVQVGVQAHADRYTYLPHIGLLVMLTWALRASTPLRTLPAAGRTGLGAAVVLALAALAVGQVARWETSESVWRHALACTESNSVAHAQLGVALEAQGRFDEAAQQYRAAIAIQDDYATPRYNLGNYLTSRGDVEGAIEQYEAAIRARPDYAKAYNNLGATLSAAGRTREALDVFARAVRADPGHIGARLNLAAALAAAGELDEAQQRYREITAAFPAHAAAHIGLGATLARLGRTDEALASYRRALGVDPRSAEAHGALGIALASNQKLQEGLEHLERAARLEPDSPTRHGNLAMALEQAGDRARALEHFERAAALARARGDGNTVRTLEARARALRASGL